MRTHEKFGFNIYEAGDRVILTESSPDGNSELIAGDTGTVLYENRERGDWVAVQWDKKTEKGYTINDNCERGHGWKVERDCITLFEPDDTEVHDKDIARESELLAFIGL